MRRANKEAKMNEIFVNIPRKREWLQAQKKIRERFFWTRENTKNLSFPRGPLIAMYDSCAYTTAIWNNLLKFERRHFPPSVPICFPSPSIPSTSLVSGNKIFVRDVTLMCDLWCTRTRVIMYSSENWCLYRKKMASFLLRLDFSPFFL